MRRGGTVAYGTALALARAGQVWGEHNGYVVRWWTIMDGKRRQVTRAIEKAIRDSDCDLVEPVAPSGRYTVKFPTTNTPGESEPPT